MGRPYTERGSNMIGDSGENHQVRIIRHMGQGMEVG